MRQFFEQDFPIAVDIIIIVVCLAIIGGVGFLAANVLHILWILL